MLSNFLIFFDANPMILTSYLFVWPNERPNFSNILVSLTGFKTEISKMEVRRLIDLQ